MPTPPPIPRIPPPSVAESIAQQQEQRGVRQRDVVARPARAPAPPLASHVRRPRWARPENAVAWGGRADDSGREADGTAEITTGRSARVRGGGFKTRLLP